jgi:hypothetical protein
MRKEIKIFHYSYDFGIEEAIDDPYQGDYHPNFNECYDYCFYVVDRSKMEKEIPIMALVYIERFLTKTGILLNKGNWRRLVMISLIIASKVMNH